MQRRTTSLDNSLNERLFTAVLKHRGRLFDGLIILLETIIFWFLGDVSAFVVDKASQGPSGEMNLEAILLAGLWVAAFGSQMVGSWLKRLPLQRRLAQQTRGFQRGVWGCLGGLLLLLHFVWSLVNSALALTLLCRPSNEAVHVTCSVLGVVVSIVSTVLVIRALKPLPVSVEVKEPDAAAERRADLFLFPGMILGALAFDFMATFWVQDVLLEAFREAASLGSLIFGLFIYIFIFAIVYLPPRLLFLVEDYRSRWTWVGIGLVSVPPLAFFFV
jgi:hypothetical protein